MTENELKKHYKVEYYNKTILLYEKEPSKESYYKYKYLTQVALIRKGWYQIIELNYQPTNNINVFIEDINKLDKSREFISDSYNPSLTEHTRFLLPIYNFLYKNGFEHTDDTNVFINYNRNVYNQSNPIILKLYSLDEMYVKDVIKVGIINDTTKEYIYSEVEKDTKTVINTIKEYLLSLYMVESASNYINSYKVLNIEDTKDFNLDLYLNAKSDFNFNFRSNLIKDLESLIDNLKSI